MLELIAHNLRSRENVGSLFRTCDSLGVAKLWLTGYTPAPPDNKISKVALGAEQTVPFETATDVQGVIEKLKGQGYAVYALELTSKAVELSDFNPPPKLAMVLGTETTGVAPSVLDRCEGAIQIAQRGKKESLNVAVAAGIAAWAILAKG